MPFMRSNAHSGTSATVFITSRYTEPLKNIRKQEGG